MGQLKLALLLILVLTISSFVSVFAVTSGDLSVVFGKTYQIHYEAKDSQVQSVEINKESQSLIFSVQETSETATLQFTLPRELIDSTKNDGTDDKFIVLVDETFAAETEKEPSSKTRTILIPLVSGNKQVEIIGTHLGITTLTSTNNTLPIPSSLITTPTTSAEQKPIENKTNQQTMSQTITLQSPSNMSQAKSVQEQLLQQIISLVHFKSGYLSLNMGEKQIAEYSIIGAIILVVIIVIASSVRSQNKKPIRK